VPVARANRFCRAEAPGPTVGPAPRAALCRAADRRILERLTNGLSAGDIPRVEKLGVRRAPGIITAMPESLEIDPPAGSVQLQIARISQAMIVTHTMTRKGNLKPVERPQPTNSERGKDIGKFSA
jgi:hypothetical protein